MSAPRVRMAREEDAAALLAIYAPYVRDTAITFEYVPPSAAAFAERIRATLQTYPYLVAEGDCGPIGYAYAGRFRPRAAYDWMAETTVYVAQDARGQGAGRLLYERLLGLLARQGVQKAYACVTWPNAPSIAFHQRMGFAQEARFPCCGYKLGQWRDVVYLSKPLGAFQTPPPPLKTVWEVLGADAEGGPA